MSIQYIHGDCLEKMKELADKSVDCFICDLPYGCLTPQTYKGVIDKSGSDLGKTYGEKITWDIKIDLEKFWTEVKRLAKNDHTPVIHFCNTRFGAELIASNPSWFRYDLVWSKTNGVGFLSANKQPLRSHEMIYIFSKKGAYYKRIDIEGDFPNTISANHKRSSNQNVYRIAEYESKNNEGRRCVKSVIQVVNKKIKGGHPTQKPIELYKWLLSRYCPEGGTVLDPTAGSFSSCIAGKELGLNCIGIEKDEGFYTKAIGS